MKISGKVFLLIATTLGSVTAFAQAPATLKSAVEQAILQNPEVKLRFHNLEAVQQERKVAEGGWLPRVDLEAATGTYNTLRPSLSSALDYSGNRASIQLRQTLFDGFATSNDVRRLSYSQQAAYFDLLAASNQTALETARAYLDVMRYRDLVALAATNYTTHLEVHDRLEQKTKAGVGRRVDLEQASGRLALAESNWLTEASNLHDVSARYQRLVGELPAPSLAPADPLKASIVTGQAFLSAGVKKNPEFLGAVSTLRAYRADSQLRRSAYSPTLEFRARQSFETNQSGVTGDYRDSALELVLNFNLYRGGSDKARIKQYLAKLDSAFDLRDKTCRDLWQTGQIAFNDSVRLAKQIPLLAQHELSTSKARQAYQQQFDIGQRSLLDLLDTENELYQARRALANAEYDQKLSQIRLLATEGSLLNAMKLRPMADAESAPSGGAEEDSLMLCNNHMPVMQVLDRTVEPRPVAVEAPVPAPLPVAAPLPAPAPQPAQAPANQCAQLPQVVESWIAAWNGKKTSDYLGYYASNFTPALGMSRTAWETLRKKRISKQGDIKAVISDIKPLACNGKTADVAFKQEYGSVDYRDSVEKTLSLEQVDGSWKILRETVTKGRTF
ncbi:MAG: TolC family outer membrane protein [Burkholderiales bacterium]|nr:TolC family outer membrane protein [Burkholderiales bacterium]